MSENGTIVSFDALVNANAANEHKEDTTSAGAPSIPAEPPFGYNIEPELEPEPKGDEPKGDEPKGDEPEPKAPDYEKMFKDTQAAYTKARQEIAALKTKAAALEAEIQEKGYSIDEAVAEELETLKYTDPEAWRQKLNAIESQRAKDIDSKIAAEVEVERRTQLLAEYNAANPNYQLNDYVAQNVLPGSFMRRLDAGEITFEGFIAEASDYLKRVKVGPGNSDKAGKTSPIRQMDGSSSPSPQGSDTDIQYKDAIF